MGYSNGSDAVPSNLRELGTKEKSLPACRSAAFLILREHHMPKEFKDIEGLVGILNSRGVETNENTAPALIRESYYAIINGYKDTFLDREAMQRSDEDVYKPGTTFAQIYDLFLFDREMRSAVFPFLTKAESIMKNAVVYSFCDRHRAIDAYLRKSSYVNAKDMLVPAGYKGDRTELHDRNLSNLLRILRKKLKVNDRTPMFIRHYLERHGEVPLWVLQNDLTFGNVEHFYQLQTRGVQNQACRIIGGVAGHGARIGALQLLTAFEILVGFRNICAHADRFYCASVKGAHVDKMLSMLMLVLPSDELEVLEARMSAIVKMFGGRIDPRALNSMYTDTKDIPEEYR